MDRWCSPSLFCMEPTFMYTSTAHDSIFSPVFPSAVLAEKSIASRLSRSISFRVPSRPAEIKILVSRPAPSCSALYPSNCYRAPHNHCLFLARPHTSFTSQSIVYQTESCPQLPPEVLTSMNHPNFSMSSSRKFQKLCTISG